MQRHTELGCIGSQRLDLSARNRVNTWLDTVDGVTGTSNSYFTDTVGDISGATMSTSMGAASTTQNQREARMFNVFKYRNNSASLDTSAPDTRG